MTFRLRFILVGVCAVGIPLAIYLASLHRGVDYWDTGELQTVPYILGIAHPSGFPAYVLFGWLWSHVLPFGDPAYRMNVLSAVAMATAAGALAACVIELGAEPVFAAGAAVLFALTRVPWDHAVRADVHALGLATIAVSFWAALRWRRTGSQRALLACAVTAAAALGVHSGMILLLPGVVLTALGRRPPLASAALCVAIGIATVAGCYAYLPLRSAVVYAQQRDPTLALGVPPGRPFWDFDHPSTPAGFRSEVGGGEFGTFTALRRLADPAVLAALPQRYGVAAVGDLAGGVMIVALVGVCALVIRAPLAALGIVGGSFVPVLFVLAYPAESDPERYYLPSYWAIGACIGLGADLLARGGLARAPRPIVAILTALFVFVSAGNAYANRGAFAVAGDDSARRFIERIVRETPADAILVAPWMYATPLAYAAYVEGRLGRRIVLTGWAGDYDAYYATWIARRPIVFITDDPTVAVSGVLVRGVPGLTPAPHLFTAQAMP